MKPLLKGLIHVTGEHDTGKTTFALEAGLMPEEIVFFDHDVKAMSVVDQLKTAGHEFLQYHNLVDLEEGKKPVELHEICLKLIDEIPDKTQLIIWDNWTPFENTFHPYVEAYPSKFRDKWPSKGDIKGAVMWQESFKYEAQIIGGILEKVPLMIITTHLKSHILNNVRTGKMVPATKKTIAEKAIMRVWLRHNPLSPRPSGLILKRPGKVEITNSGMKTINVFPRRMSVCTWETIREQWENPLGDKEPTPEQVPDTDEIALLEGVLTPDQQKIYELGAVAMERIAQEEDKEVEKKAKARMQEILDEKPGIKLPKLKKILEKEDFEVTIPLLVGWINDEKGE